ncbi:MAG: acyl-CoA--6-aminopenicillanic acid acyl-transferase [Anaerolineales bacterium]
MNPNRNCSIKFIEAKGTHREVGQQIGEACKDKVQHSIESARSLVNALSQELKMDWHKATIQAQKYLPYVYEYYPQYLEEIKGIAEASHSSLDDIFALNAFEGIVMDRLHLSKCTSFAVNQSRTLNGNVLVCHNEDWFPDDEEDVYIVRAEIDDEPPFLAMSYGGLLPNVGLNAAGIAQCCDTVYPKEKRVGIPRVVVGRAVLGARTISDAIHRAISPHRAAGYNHLIAHESGEIYNVEVSARNFAIQYGEMGFLAHANHYLSQKMQVIEDEPEELIGSQVRYFRVLRLIKETDKHDLASLQQIQRDHVNYPNSICCHATEPENPYDREKTICAMVMDLTEKTVYLAWGNPCQSLYYPFTL